jgi:hypothetical protein
MSSIEKLKAEATALEEKARASGRPIKHCVALEEVAKRHGFENWRACSASLEKAPVASALPPKARPTNPVKMKRYLSSEWRFALDIPADWNSFPAVSSNSPFEVIRFMSHEEGIHVLIIFRSPHDPKKTPREHSDQIQQVLAKGGFGNFVNGETSIQSHPVHTLDFDQPRGDIGTWSCRHYFMFDRTLCYTLGFGTVHRAAMIDLYDRVARSFEILPEPSQS